MPGVSNETGSEAPTTPTTSTPTATGAPTAPTTPTTTSTPTTTTALAARSQHRAGEAWAAHLLHARFEQSAQRLDDDDNFAVLSGGDNHITREDLERVRDGEVEASDELRDEAAFLLDSETFRNALDVGDGVGVADDKISRDDVRAARETLSTQDWTGETIGVSGAIDSEDEARAVLDRYLFLTDAADGVGGRNAHYSNDDVATLLDDPNIPEDLRSAAQYIQSNEVSLPGDGSSLWGTVTSPLSAAGGALSDAGGGAFDWSTGQVRDNFFEPVDLSDAQHSELLGLAEDAASTDRGRDAVPFNEQQNAHHSNTIGEMREALEGDYDWLEGDVRRDPPVMGHDLVSGGGLRFEDWLEIGAASGRGLKIDIKERGSIDGIIEAVQASGVPEDQLMFNVDAVTGPGGSGVNATPDDVRRLREAFPDAHIAIGAVTGGTSDGTTYTEAQVSQMIALADDIGGSVFFPLRAELVTPQIVERLEAHGNVSIWNSPRTYALDGPDAIAADAQRFRDMGVEGIIDLR